MGVAKMDGNIRYLPQVKRKLQQMQHDITDDINRGMYETALEKIAIFYEHQFMNEQLQEQHLICLIHLERWEEAEALVGTLMDETTESFNERYAFYYAKSLFRSEEHTSELQSRGHLV